VLTSVRHFVSGEFPKPAATEASFWSAPLFPERRLIRINGGQQKFFNVD
jgi:hypothetical protein